MTPVLYATRDDLARREGHDALAEKASESRSVTGELLLAMMTGADVAAYSAEARADAELALERIDQALADASAEVAVRIGDMHPDPETAPHALRAYAADIAIHRLFGGERGDVRYERARAAIEYMDGMAAGGEPAARPGGGPAFAAPPRTFDGDSLGGF